MLTSGRTITYDPARPWAGWCATPPIWPPIYSAAGRAFTDASLRKPGDLIFHSTHQNNRFLSISHVSIVSDNIDQFYNVTDLSKTVVRTNYANRNADIVFFARPDYERIPQQTYTFDPNHNYLAYPWIFGNSNTYPSRVTATASESGVTTACSGATAATVIPLVSSNYPLYLPAGTYQLSGTPAYSDRRARVDYSYWGLRLYPTDGRSITSQVTGFSSAKYTSAPVAVSQTQNHVWERATARRFPSPSRCRFIAASTFLRPPTTRRTAAVTCGRQGSHEGNKAKPPEREVLFYLFWVLFVFTNLSTKPTTSGGDIFRCTFFTNFSTKPTTSGGHIFLCLKKDMEERQTKGAAAPVGSPG